MLFNSYLFIILFLPVAALGYAVLRHRTDRRFLQAWIVVISLIFYMSAGLVAVLLIFFEIGVVYSAARWCLPSEDRRLRRLGMGVGLLPTLVLILFKVGILANGQGQGSNLLLGVALPLGISFYTFNMLSYVMDVRAKRIEPERSVLAFAGYSLFFPTLSSGPLVRYGAFRTQADMSKTPSQEMFGLGIWNFTLGLAKKLIIADNFAPVVTVLFSNAGRIGAIGAWVAALAFTMQLYFDFSGYCDMAVGIGYLLGFNLPRNFDTPYTASNITVFWNRWHITLSTWFRDYFFTPLSRTLLRRWQGRSGLIRSACLILTMVLIGLWHGVTAPFVLWGAYHGLLLAYHAAWHQRFGQPLPVWLGRIITFGLVVVGWVIFRSATLGDAAHILTAMVGLRGTGASDLKTLLSNVSAAGLVLSLGVTMFIVNLPRDLRDMRPTFGWLQCAALAMITVLCLILLNQTTTFLYIQF